MKPALINIAHVHIHVAPPVNAIAATLSTTSEAATANRFVLTTSHGASLVTDYTTGLQWAAEESAERMDFAAAEKYCAELRLGGRTDWRLPDLTELESIRDLSRHEPCVDTAFFKSNSSWVWSRTPCAWSPGHAWIVYFGDGYVYSLHRYYTAFVRAVRGVSPAGQ